MLLLLFVAATFTSCKTIQGSSDNNRGHHHTTRGSRGHRHHHNKPDKPNGPQAGDEQWARLDIPLTDDDDEALFDELRTWLGTPYRYAGNDKGEGVDCSGLVVQVYLTVYGIPLERRSADIFDKNCTPINKSDLRQGDLVFFDTSKKGGISHVGIYLRDNYFVHASSSRGVMVSNLTQPYWQNHYHTSGRLSQLKRR